MKESRNSIQDGHISLSNSLSPTSKLHNNESKSIPLNLSLLKFQERSKNQKLIKTLYEDPETKKPSEEFKLNLIYYSTYILIYLLSLLGFAILLKNSGQLSSVHLNIHIVCISLLLAFAVIISIGVLTSVKKRRITRTYFLVFSCFFNFYLIFTDERILHKLTGQSYNEANLPMSLGLVCTITLVRLVLFEYYLFTFIIGSANTVIFLTAHLSISEYPIYATLAEALIIGLFCIMNVAESYRADFRIKQIFWRREQLANEDSSISKKNDQPQTPGINTETEKILEKCDTIAYNLKKINKVVIYKDVKKMLKKSLADLEKIKRKVAHGGFESLKIELSPEIDEEDQTFIFENFMDVHSADSSKSFSSNFTEKFVSSPHSGFTSNELDNVLSDLGKNWNFDVFFVNDTTGHCILTIGKYLFRYWGLTDYLKVDENITESFLLDLEKTYLNNLFHNACHASDVLCSFWYFIISSSLVESLTYFDVIAVVVSSLGHDAGHPGFTNRYLINSQDTLAIQYNDKSVLESMHCHSIFNILNKPESDIFKSLRASDYFPMRKQIIEMILDLDISKHYECLSKYKSSSLSPNTKNSKSSILSIGLKCSDFGYLSKEKDLHIRWANLAIEELFIQGDMEKKLNLSISTYCDRLTTNVPKYQIGIIRYICFPLYEIWCKYLDSEMIDKVVLAKINSNMQYWQSKINKGNWNKNSGLSLA